MPDNDTESNSNKISTSGGTSGNIKDPRAKRMFGVLVVIAFFAILFGSIGIYSAIRDPFKSTVPSNITGIDTDEIASLEVLRSDDIDNDGLSDYDELYRYNTSPYLSDSDSDGVSDAEEINADSDPNCPSDKDCSGLIGNVSDSNVNSNQPEVNAQELRQTLENAGAPKYVLDSTDDQALLELYQQTLNEQTDTTNTSTTNTSITNTTEESGDTVDAETLNNLTAEEIRSLLLLNGVNENDLEAIDDDTLKSIFQQAVAEEFSN
ncbi:hypothetical protein ACFL04_03795 [Patescibacteria group bacterium]